MELVLSKDSIEIWMHKYVDGTALHIPFGGESFVCVIWNNRKDFVSRSIAEELLSNNCKYLLCGGFDCEDWETMADVVDIDLHPDDGSLSTSDIAMTTSHKDQTMKEVIWFALHNTDVGTHEFKKYLILQIDEKFTKIELLEWVS